MHYHTLFVPASSNIPIHLSLPFLSLFPFFSTFHDNFELHLPLPQTINATDKLSLDFITSGSRHKLTKLMPATQYEVKVMVVAAAVRGGRNLTCVADGTGRERVHSVTFTTLCPRGVVLQIMGRYC